MNNSDPLQCLLVDFFNLPPDTLFAGNYSTGGTLVGLVGDGAAVADIEGTFSVEFDLDEIDVLRSYDEIHWALSRKGISFTSPAPSSS